MPTSRYEHISDTLSVLVALGPQSLLDVGCGFGRWGFLAREVLDVLHGRYDRKDWRVRVDAVEIHEGYIRPHHRYIYDHIHIGAIEDRVNELESYDVVYAGDVIEHLDKDVAEATIEGLRRKSRKALIVALPLGEHWEQSGTDANPHEEHRSTWTRTDLRRLGASFVRSYEVEDGREYGVAVWSPLPLLRFRSRLAWRLRGIIDRARSLRRVGLRGRVPGGIAAGGMELPAKEDPDKIGRKLTTPLYCAIALVGGWLAAICASRIVYPFDVGHYEAYMWAPAQLILNGENPFAARHATGPPYTLAAYGPLYYLLIAIGINAFGLQLWFGRLLSAVAAAACIGAIGWICRRLTDDVEAALFAMLTVAAQAPLQHWVAIQRSDVVGLAFSFTGVALLLTGASLRSAIVSGLFLAAGFFCKQVFVLPILAAFGLACARRAGRRVVASASVTSLTILLVVILLNATSGGGYLWQHWKLPRGLERNWGNALAGVQGLAKVPATWVLASIVLTAWAFPAPRRSRGGVRVMEMGTVVYALAAAVLAFVLSSFRGSNVNYWLEASLAASLAAGLAWRRLPRRVAISFVVATVLAAAVLLARLTRGEYYRWASLPYYEALVETVRRSVPPGAPGISSFPELLVAADRPYHFNDYMQYEDGRSPELVALIDGAIRSGRYAAIINLSPAPPPGYTTVEIASPPRRFWRVYLHLRRSAPRPGFFRDAERSEPGR